MSVGNLGTSKPFPSNLSQLLLLRGGRRRGRHPVGHRAASAAVPLAGGRDRATALPPQEDPLQLRVVRGAAMSPGRPETEEGTQRTKAVPAHADGARGFSDWRAQQVRRWAAPEPRHDQDYHTTYRTA